MAGVRSNWATPERWIDGECVPAVPDRRNEHVDRYFADVCVPGWTCDWAALDPCYAEPNSAVRVGYEFLLDRWVTGARLLEIGYRHLSWRDGEDGVPVPVDRFGFSVEHGSGTHPNFETYEVALPVATQGDVGEFAFDVPAGTSWVELLRDDVERLEECMVSGGLEVLWTHAYTVDTPICERVFEAGGELSYCPERTPVVNCDEPCVDLTNDPFNCGGCGITCTGLDICLGGTCVCPPEIEERTPSACDGCPVGFGGPDCAWECLGQIGESIYCNGRGTCPIGPYGDGHCECDEGYHGLACEVSCSDGIRNGDEWGLDCGRPCGYGCGRFDGSPWTSSRVPVPIVREGME